MFSIKGVIQPRYGSLLISCVFTHIRMSNHHLWIKQGTFTCPCSVCEDSK